jgi:hypothetical protein
MILKKNRSFTKNKGGRPKQVIKKDRRVSVRCSFLQRKQVQLRAKNAQLTVSEYLLKMGLTGKIVIREKVLPPEVLKRLGELNHIAAYLNQIAKKRNGFDELSAYERATLAIQSNQVKLLAQDIKNYLK